MDMEMNNNGSVHPGPVHERDTISSKCWHLETDDTILTLEVIGNRQFICELRNPARDWNWTPEKSEMPLLKKVNVNGVGYEPDWKFISESTSVDNGDGMKIVLTFASTEPSLVLDSIWEAKPGCGPVTNHMTVCNNTGSSMTCSYSDMVSAEIRVKSDEKCTLWRFTKSKLLPFEDCPGEPDANTGVFKYIFNKNSSFSANITNEVENLLPTNHPRLPFEVFDIGSKHGLYFGYEWAFGKFIDMTESDPSQISHKAYLWDTGKVTLDADKALSIPASYFGTYAGDVDDGSNRMKKWFWNHKITETVRNHPDEPLIEYCVPENEADLIDFYRDYPVGAWGGELAKIDISWLDGCPLKDYWWNGDFMKYSFWNPDPNRWPNGMTAGSLVHAQNQKLSLYMCNTYQNCDIGTQEGRDLEKAGLLSRYDAFHYDYWRSDFDLENTPFDYLTHEGLLEILDYMIASRPGFRYEHCAGGGSLKDFSTLQRISVFTSEDSALPLNHRKAFYTNSYMINPVQIKADIAMAAKSGDRAWHDYCCRTGFLGANMASTLFTADTVESIREHLPIYAAQQRRILRGACVYHILPIPDGVNWDGMEFFNDSIQEGSVLLFKPSANAADGDSKTVKLKGLDRNKEYGLRFQERTCLNCSLTGAELIDQGIRVSAMSGEYASEIIWIAVQKG